MQKKTYSEKLKDPRWQKKRLEIFQRDNFACRLCGATNKTLHVHHKYYEQGKEPWEYDDYFLSTFCDDCHEYEHNIRPSYEASLLEEMRKAGISADAVNYVSVFFKASIHFRDKEVLKALIDYMKPFVEKFQEDVTKDFPG